MCDAFSITAYDSLSQLVTQFICKNINILVCGQFLFELNPRPWSCCFVLFVLFVILCEGKPGRAGAEQGPISLGSWPEFKTPWPLANSIRKYRLQVYSVNNPLYYMCVATRSITCLGSQLDWSHVSHVSCRPVFTPATGKVGQATKGYWSLKLITCNCM